MHFSGIIYHNPKGHLSTHNFLYQARTVYPHVRHLCLSILQDYQDREVIRPVLLLNYCPEGLT